MKALVKYDHGHGNMEIRDVEIPSIKDSEVLVKVKAASICGTDLHIYEGNWPVNPPVTIGHEFAGEIAEVGKKVKGWNIGDRIVSETHGYVCEKCLYCRIGKPNLCVERRGLGYIINGAFAEYISVREPILHKLPDNISFKDAAIVEPLADVIHAIVVNSKISIGDTIIILGPGPVGLLALLIAKLNGASPIIVTGTSRDKMRLEMAHKLGADYIVNVQSEDLEKKVKDLTGGLGVDTVIEASGAIPAISQAFKIVKKGGKVTLMGIPSRPAELDINSIILNELSISGTFVNTWADWERALKLMSSGRVDVEPLITHTFALTEWEKAFELLIEAKAIKAVFLNP